MICGVALWGCRQPDATIRRLMQSEGKPARAVLRALDSIPDVTLLNDEDWHAYLYLRAKARYELKRIQPRDTVLVETMEYFNAKGKPAQAGLLALCTGRAYQLAGNYTQALHYDLEAEQLARQTGNISLQLGVLYEQGHLCSHSGDLGNALEHFEAFIRLIEKHPEMQEKLTSGNLFLDAGNTLLHLQRFEEAAEYFDLLTDKILNTLDPTIASYALYKKAYTLNMLEHPQEALVCAQHSLTYATHRKERLRNYLLIADIYRKEELTDSVSATLARAEKELTPENREGKAGYYWLLSGLYKEKGDYQQALESLLQYDAIMDTTTAPRMRIREDRYRMHYEQMQAEMRLLRDRNRGLLIFCCAFAMIVALGIIVYSLYRRTKRQKKLLAKHTESLHGIATSNLQFMRKLTKIQSCPSDQNLFFLQRLDDIFFDGTRKIIDNREKICNAIDLLYDNFRPRLKTAYPDLNEQEIELCCLMRANIDTKDIATLIGQSVYSVQKRRTTIRKKLAMRKAPTLFASLKPDCTTLKNDLLLSPFPPSKTTLQDFVF